jgi:hypothetical protein
MTSINVYGAAGWGQPAAQVMRLLRHPAKAGFLAMTVEVR